MDAVGGLGQSSWSQAHRALSTADPGALAIADLERLAEAAFWLGRPRESISARQKVYARFREIGDEVGAARTAWLLFHNHFDLDQTAVAGGWLKRARRHAANATGRVEPGYVRLADSCWALHQGDADAAVEAGHDAIHIAQRFGDRDLEVLGLAVQARALMARGEVAEGVAQLDEAMAGVLGDELTPFATGWVYCLLLFTCQELGDVRRASEWTELAVRWCEQRGYDSWYPGLCRLHQCEVKSLRGDWSAAESEALKAAEELAPFGDYLIADGQYLVGEIRRRKGDYAGAAAAFRRAHEHGRDPQPGLALLQLAQGNTEVAAVALRVALAAEAGTPLRRGRLLAAYVRTELHRGKVDSAAEPAAELSALAGTTGSLLLRALADLANGAVSLARGDAAAALPLLRNACAICRELSCPYEAAETRVLVGVASAELGDAATARMELEAAKTAFERLGATPDIARVDALLIGGSPAPDGLTSREVQVLRLVAAGLSNREIAVRLFISEHTVARHLSNIFRKLAVTSRAAATSYAYEHHLT